jgi:hypothetical protein
MVSGQQNNGSHLRSQMHGILHRLWCQCVKPVRLFGCEMIDTCKSGHLRSFVSRHRNPARSSYLQQVCPRRQDVR